ncbi:MAG: hypothetical protein EON88_02080 [Brevundimonas sp.]|nr:MAG: hypothetical protein EON88_02080 [Brevundimonas sp.]
MRAFQVGTTSVVLSLAALLTACAGDPGGGPGRTGNPFEAPPPPQPSLFISPFGEPFVAQPGEAYPSAKWFAGADADHDGAVTLEEFTADGARFFAILDADHDGRLNQTELADYETGLRRFGGMPTGPGRGEARGFPNINILGPAGGGEDIPLADASTVDTSTLGAAPQQQRRRRQATRGRGGRPQGYGVIAESGFFNLPQPVKSADINVDQRVSAEEWAQATQRWFYSLDTDRDGRLTLATLPVTPAQARHARGR